jgi:ribonuclease HI
MVWPNHPHLTGGWALEGDSKTNNRAEYTAAIRAIEAADKEDPSKTEPLCIYTDSELLINTVTKWMHSWQRNGWKKASSEPIMNEDLVRRLFDLIAQSSRKVRWIHVKAHTNGDDWESKWNDKADKLAKSAAT